MENKLSAEYRVGLYTLGCKVSQYETEAVGEAFEREGFKLSAFSERNDVYVINTCTVTAESDRKCRQVIRRAHKTNPEALIMVMGCYSQRAPDDLLALEGVTAVIGTENKLSLPSLAKSYLLGEKKEKYKNTTDVTKASFERMRITRAPRTRAYVKIEDGCEAKCSYCAISAARGRVRSKPKSDVIEEVEALYAGGTREIVLTGIETGSYGRDLEGEYRLQDLICELDARGSCERLRLGSLAPELINSDFINKVKNAKILAPHFHLSMQSGSDKILGLMRRRYNKDRVLSLIREIRRNIEGVTFTTDLMVGFPGEDEEDFLETVDFVKEARLLDAHVFAYSKRDGTPAAYFDGQIPECVKRERSARLIEEKNKVRDALLSRIISEGRELSVIAESYSSGYYTAHSKEYIEVSFASECKELSGEMLTVIPVSHKNGVVNAILKDKK